MDRADPVCLRNRTALRVGDRNDWNFRKGLEHRLMLGEIETTVQRCQEWRWLSIEERKRVVIEMEVQKIELYCCFTWSSGSVRQASLTHDTMSVWNVVRSEA
jgi:hypothetical protein